MANAAIFGERAPAMRIRLDAGLMASHGITTGDIASALEANSIELPAGELGTGGRQIQLLARTGMGSAEEFAQLQIRDDGARPLRLGDVARIEAGPSSTDSIFRSDGVTGLGLGIQPHAQANTVAIGDAVRAELELLRPTLPEGMQISIATDEPLFIETAFDEVAQVFHEAVLLATAAILLFLGSARLSLVPAVTIPVLILGPAISMALLGFSVKIMTLFAMILAIGLVVDGATAAWAKARPKRRARAPTR